jgi:hypothetical protein
VDYYQGDNPGSRFFAMDQIRRLGVRYFWTVNSDYWQATASGVALPEVMAATGRPSIFRVHAFNDGSSGLMFMRNLASSGPRTLQLLAAPRLAELKARSGRSILYLHWLTNPQSYFSADGLAALDALNRERDSIWVASAEQLLDQAYAYSFVQYTVGGDHARTTVAITGVLDPIDGLVPIGIERLANLSFRCRGCAALDVTVQGRRLAADAIDTVHEDGDVIVTVKPTNG